MGRVKSRLQFDSRLKKAMSISIPVSNHTRLGGNTTHDRLKCYQKAREKTTVIYYRIEMLYMLQWTTEMFMEIEIAHKVGVQDAQPLSLGLVYVGSIYVSARCA